MMEDHDDPYPGGAAQDDAALLHALCAGDEGAFALLVTKYHPALIRIATLYVADVATAEEVAQETWLAVLRGLAKFEGRSSLETWIFRILANRARTRGRRDRRMVPFAALVDAKLDRQETTVDPSCFRAEGDPYPGHWVSYPPAWTGPEERALAQETRAYLDAAIAQLPPAQRAVLVLRDVHGLAAHEVCQILDLSTANQRVLLHRARAKMRRALGQYMGEGWVRHEER